jgi:hypothetical protein
MKQIKSFSRMLVVLCYMVDQPIATVSAQIYIGYLQRGYLCDT